MTARATATLAAILFVGLAPGADAAGGTKGPAHAMAMHGEPKYSPDFKNFDYVNPNAPKGGKVVFGAIGTFDSLNPYIVKGTPSAVAASIYETLLVSSADEAFTEYCHLCETIEVPDDRKWVEFTLRPEARWQDGRPITVDDVIWSFTTLREKGRPFYRSYYKNVTRVEKTADRKVRFTFGGEVNNELPLIMGQLTVLPKHYWETRDFTATTLDPPLGSGQFRIKTVEPGSSITLERVKDYWGAKLPTVVGTGNFDEIRYDYYRDSTVALEAFKGGNFDIRGENVARNWATAYDTPAVRAGLLVKGEFRHQRTAGMQGFALNQRRPLFEDRRVREALGYAFDFEWTNANIFYGAYTRTDSYFDNSELASFGRLEDLPADAEERRILEGYRDRLPGEVFTKAFTLPKTDGSGNNRANLRTAGELLDAAGWVVRDGKRVHAQTGKPFEFEVVYVDPSSANYATPYKQSLERLGITMRLRQVDASQYQEMMEGFDFDMTTDVWGQSLSPGNEQRDHWGTASATERGGGNSIGIKDKVIDELVELIIQAPDRESLVQRTRALDRVLLWGHYVVPHWHLPHDRVAYWDKFGQPDVIPMQGVSTGAWWIDPAKEVSLVARRAALR